MRRKLEALLWVCQARRAKIRFKRHRANQFSLSTNFVRLLCFVSESYGRHLSESIARQLVSFGQNLAYQHFILAMDSCKCEASNKKRNQFYFNLRPLTIRKLRISVSRNPAAAPTTNVFASSIMLGWLGWLNGIGWNKLSMRACNSLSNSLLDWMSNTACAKSCRIGSDATGSGRAL